MSHNWLHTTAPHLRLSGVIWNEKPACLTAAARGFSATLHAVAEPLTASCRCGLFSSCFSLGREQCPAQRLAAVPVPLFEGRCCQVHAAADCGGKAVGFGGAGSPQARPQQEELEQGSC